VCITPPIGTWQGGFGARNRPCEGIHDDLYARAVVFETSPGGAPIAMVAADLIGLEPRSVQHIRSRAAALTGIPAERMLISCTHTHGGPSTLDLFGLGDGATADQPADPEYVAIVEKLIAGAVAAAARTPRPATLSLGEGAASFHVNRRFPLPDGGVTSMPNPAGVLDRRIGVLRVDVDDAPDGSPLAVLYHLACHPTAMGGDNYLLTADWPGQASAFIEGAYGATAGTVAMFLQGCAGNIRPNFTSLAGRFRSATWSELAGVGRAVGGEVVRAAEQSRALAPRGSGLSMAAASTSVTVPFGPLPDREMLESELSGSRWNQGWARSMLSRLDQGSLARGIEAEVQVLHLGPLRLVAMPGEIFLEIGLRVRAALGEPAWVLGYANGLQLGYVPTAAALAEGGYETVAYRFWLHPAPPATQAEDILVATARRVAMAADADAVRWPLQPNTEV